MSDSLRKGESGNAPDRSDRVFKRGDYWYFHTREGVQVGPFDSRELASKGAGDYVHFAVDTDPKLLSTLSK